MKQILSVCLFAGLAATSACNNTTSDQVQMAQQHTIDSMRMELAHQRIVDSFALVARVQQQAITNMNKAVNKGTVARKATTTVRTYRPRTIVYRQASGYTAAPYGGYSNGAPAVTETRRKGWSAKAKGAVIGTGIGAISGAIINGRNRGVGALIGGVSGAAAGTGIGAIIDHKHGR